LVGKEQACLVAGKMSLFLYYETSSGTVAPTIITALAAPVRAVRAFSHAIVNAGVIVGGPPTRRASWFFAAFDGNLVPGCALCHGRRFTQPFRSFLPGSAAKWSVSTRQPHSDPPHPPILYSPF